MYAVFVFCRPTDGWCLHDVSAAVDRLKGGRAAATEKEID